MISVLYFLLQMEVFTVNTVDVACHCQNSVEVMFQSLCTTAHVAMMAIDQRDLIIDLLYHHWTSSLFLWLVSGSLTLYTSAELTQKHTWLTTYFFP